MQSRVFLRADAARSLVKKKFKGYEGPGSLLERWEKEAARQSSFPSTPDRGTVHDWIANGFKKHPSSKLASDQSNLLGFCALLDVDPMCLFDFHRNGYFSKFTIIRTAIQRGAPKLSAWRPLLELMEPDENWPSDFIAQTYWQRPWSHSTFDNQDSYQSLDYAAIHVEFSRNDNGDPRAVHIAYRRWDSERTDQMWRYYGTVISQDGAIDLYNEGGRHRKMAQLQPNTISFRTYFGGRKVEFKLVSLHPFKEKIDFPCNDMSIIGFDW